MERRERGRECQEKRRGRMRGEERMRDGMDANLPGDEGEKEKEKQRRRGRQGKLGVWRRGTGGRRWAEGDGREAGRRGADDGIGRRRRRN